MYLCVSSAAYPAPGQRHEYNLNDGSFIVEQPHMPAPCRWQYYDNHHHRVFNKPTQAAMRAAVERHKRKWKCG
jgi:hypothetical protein